MDKKRTKKIECKNLEKRKGNLNTDYKCKLIKDMYINPTLPLDTIHDFISLTWVKYNVVQFHIIRYDSFVFDILSKFVAQYKVDAMLYQFIDDYKIIGSLYFQNSRYHCSTIIRELRKSLKGYSLYI